MKVISWNILAHEFIKKSYYPMINSKILFNRKDRLTKITKLLKNVNADVMLLQEVMPAEYNSLYETFFNYYYIIKGHTINWDNKKSYSGNVTLLRKSVFSLSINNENALVNYLTFGIYVKCYLLDNMMNMKKTDIIGKLTPIDIINVHLDYTSHAKRTSEIQSIENEIKNSSRVILGGDFNQDYKPNAKTKLYTLIQSFGLKIYISNPTYLIDKKKCIDHIITKGLIGNTRGYVLNHYGDDVIQQFKEYGSDHLPVIMYIAQNSRVLNAVTPQVPRCSYQ